MNISQTAASRARSVDGGVFCFGRVSRATNGATSLPPSASPYAWIFALRKRVLSAETNLGSSAKLVLVTLLEYVDPEGRTWVGVETIAANGGFGSAQTVRNALQKLAREGWLKVVPQTWASLTVEQAGAGRKTPHRGDVGRAPHLYVILDGHGNPACGLSLPGLARASRPVLPDNPSRNLEERPSRNQQGGPLSKLIGDQDPSEDLSMNERVERASRVDEHTHISSDNSSRKSAESSPMWKLIVEAHVEKTKQVYGLPPLSPNLKANERRELCSSLETAAMEVRTQLQTRTGVACELDEVRRELAARTMHLYFKRDNEHLRRVKHALRDLHREWHGRLTEAMQAMLRAATDTALPRRAQRDEPHEQSVPVDKPDRIPTQTPVASSTNLAESVDKLAGPVKRKPAGILPNSTAVAQGARQVLEALTMTSVQRDPMIPSMPEDPVTTTSQVEPAQALADKPAQDKPPIESTKNSFEQQTFDLQASVDKPSTTSQPSIERPVGRSGAPRWGAIGPRPVKRPCIRKCEQDEGEVAACADGSG